MPSVATTAVRLYAVFVDPDDPTEVWAEPIVSFDDRTLATSFRTARGPKLVGYSSDTCGSGPKLLLIAERDDLPPELLPRRTMDQVLEMAREAVGGA